MQPIRVMVNGIPGNMAVTVARQVLADPRFELVPHALTGPEITAPSYPLEEIRVALVQPADRERALDRIAAGGVDFISVDYTHPSAVNANAEFFCRRGLPFVIGTTGGDRRGLVETVRRSNIAAVIAPNMAKQIVGFQAMMAYAAESFAGLFDGYRLEIRESHQRTKADTSGTARAMVGYFNQLGLPFDSDDIHRERDPEIQARQWGIPAAHLEGHAWHTYSLVSDDGSVRFQFTHNVNGREIYARGTLDAVRFLQARVQEGQKGRVYDMMDVLRGGGR